MLAPALTVVMLVVQAAAPAKAPPPPPARAAPAKAAEPVPTPPVAEAPPPKPTVSEAPRPPPPPSPTGQLRVAVSDIAAPAGQETLGVMLSGMVGRELERLELFQVTTAEQVRSLLSLERQKALLGCTEDDCGSSALNAASMLGVDLMVTGRLSRLASKAGEAPVLTLDLTLVDSRSGARKNGAVTKAQSESELAGKVPETVVALVGKVLEGKQGFLAVQVSEAGATVKIDNVVVGTSPLDGRLTLAGGPHLLRVEKESFVTSQRQVRITPDQVTTESLTLVPSPDFIQAYESREGRFRVGTWIAGGVAVLGIGGFVAMQLQADSLYSGSAAKPNFRDLQTGLNQGIETKDGMNYREAASKLKTQIETAQTISYVAGGLGLAAGIAGVTFAIISDDPGKYRQYRATTKVSGWVAPTGNGIAVGGVF